MVDAVDHVILGGTTLYIDGIQAGKAVSEFTSGIKIGRASQDDRQHAFYNVFDDFSGGFGHRQLDVREALGTHWDNPGGADLRRSRHVTLPPARFRVPAEEEPTKLILSSEILDGAAVAVPAIGSSDFDSYFYAAGNKVYRMDEDRDVLEHLQTFATGGVIQGAADTEPEKMTRAFLHRGPSNTRRLYLVTANAAGTSKMLYTEDPDAASPTWVEGARGAWDAMSVTMGAGTQIVIAQALTFEFMYSTDPTTGATDWNIDSADSAVNPPKWLPHHICRFLGVADLPTTQAPGIYFIDYGDGLLYALDFNIDRAIPVGVGDYHYITNGVIWEGQIAITDGWDVWLYQPGGGGTEVVRKIGLFGRDGVPDSLRDGRYRISGLIDGGPYLYAIAERTALDKDGTVGTLGFIILVYNGAGWSLFSNPLESPATSSSIAANPIAALIDRYPLGVISAQNQAKETSRALNVLCQTHPDNAKTLQLYSYSLPKIGSIPIDKVDEFHGDPAIDHSFLSGWFDGGFADIDGALFYVKVDLQSNGGTGGVRIGYRLNNDEAAPFAQLGVATELGENLFQFDPVSEAGIPWRTAQFEVEPQRAPTSLLSEDITDADTEIPVAELQNFPDRGLVQIDDEFIEYDGLTGAGSLYGEKNIAQSTLPLIAQAKAVPNCNVTLPDAGATYLVIGKVNISCGTVPTSGAVVQVALTDQHTGVPIDYDDIVAADDADGWSTNTERTHVGAWLVTAPSDDYDLNLLAWVLDVSGDGELSVNNAESSLTAIKVDVGTFTEKKISTQSLNLSVNSSQAVPNCDINLPESGATYLLIGKADMRCISAPSSTATTLLALFDYEADAVVDDDHALISEDADGWSDTYSRTVCGVWLVTTSSANTRVGLLGYKIDAAADGKFRINAGDSSLLAIKVDATYSEKNICGVDLTLSQTPTPINNCLVTLPNAGATYLVLGKVHFQCTGAPSGAVAVYADLQESSGGPSVDADLILRKEDADGWSANSTATAVGVWLITTTDPDEEYELLAAKVENDGTFVADLGESSITAIQIATDSPGLVNAGQLINAVRGVRGSDAAAHLEGVSVDCLNRTPELRGITLVYSKKAPLRKTWVFRVDVDRMVETGALVDTDLDGTPETAATAKNVYDFLQDLWNTQTLHELIIPEAEANGENLRVEVADFTVVQDNNRATSSTRGRIDVTVIEPISP